MAPNLRHLQAASLRQIGNARLAGHGERECAPSRILESLLDEAPELVRRRSLLPAFDWRQASADQVARLLRSLAGARVNVPLWLIKGLLVGGHRLPTATMETCSQELRILAALNALDDGQIPDALADQIGDCTRYGDMEPAVASAMVARLVALSNTSLACCLALSQARTSPEALRPVRKELQSEIAGLPSLRLRLAGTSTTHGLKEALVPAFAAAGRCVEIAEGPFGSVISELLEPDETADALAVLLDREHFLSLDWRGSAREARRLVDERLDTLTDAIKAYCRKSPRPLLVTTLPASISPTSGHIDRVHATGESGIVAELNRRLAEIAVGVPSLHLIDADHALASIAPSERSDPKLWFYGRIAYAEPALRALAHGFARVWQARERGRAKVLALDFDNTLWGGVYGDDGIGRLECGDDFPGNAFKALQQECLRLKAQGTLLVGLSKNNPDAIDVLSKHPGMALKDDDFVATAINWEPKPDNLRRLAGELGLGLESFVFLDDSPHEREAMRRMCPAVIVPELPSDPARRPQWLRSLACTWPLRLTDEDSRRSEMYVAERRGRELQESSGSYEDYITGLEQRLLVEPLSVGTLPRAAQLHERTNQFNLTTRRLGEADLRTYLSGESRAAFVGRVSDRFGDHGLVLAACATVQGDTARIETLVMSCRVIGREIEAAFLDAIAEALAKRGAKRLVGLYRPTAKNAIVRDFYPSLGFAAAGDEDGADLWEKLLVGSAAPRLRPVTVEWGTR